MPHLCVTSLYGRKENVLPKFSDKFILFQVNSSQNVNLNKYRSPYIPVFMLLSLSITTFNGILSNVVYYIQKMYETLAKTVSGVTFTLALS